MKRGIKDGCCFISLHRVRDVRNVNQKRSPSSSKLIMRIIIYTCIQIIQMGSFVRPDYQRHDLLHNHITTHATIAPLSQVPLGAEVRHQ